MIISMPLSTTVRELQAVVTGTSVTEVQFVNDDGVYQISYEIVSRAPLQVRAVKRMKD